MLVVCKLSLSALFPPLSFLSLFALALSAVFGSLLVNRKPLGTEGDVEIESERKGRVGLFFS